MSLRIVHEAAFDGPNLWSDSPVVRVVLQGSPALGALERITGQLEQLDRQLDRTQLDPLPLSPLPDQSSTPWLLAWSAIGLQRLAGDDCSFYSARNLEFEDASEVVIACHHRQTGFLALRIALRQLNSPADYRNQHDGEVLRHAFTQRLVLVAASRRPDHENACILAAARAREIPITSVDPRGLVYELGTGIYRRRLQFTATSNTSAIGRAISRDKQRSLHFLAECGLPVPDTLTARDPDTAVAHARALGFPITIKPIDEGNSAGLHLDLRDDDEIRDAFQSAASASRSNTVVVQRYLHGRHYRILVIGGRIVGVSERIAAHVVGDGKHSIRELVEIKNRDPRRGPNLRDPLKPIAIDQTTDRLLRQQGLVLDDVPPSGLEVQLQRIDDMELGGEAIERMCEIHPDNATIAISAARLLEIDVAGIDMIAEEISRSIWETSGALLEVNCDTGFSLIQFPTSGNAIDPGPAVIETLFPPGVPVRVPLVAVTGARETPTICHLLGILLSGDGITGGISAGGELSLGSTRLGGIDGRGVKGKRRILLNPAVEMAVLEIPPDEIVAEGLAFEQCDVAVVTSLSGVSPAGLPAAESVVCRTVAPEGMLIVAGDDAAAIELARTFDRPIVLYGIECSADAIANHRRAGDRSVLLRENGGRTVLDIAWGSGHPATCTLPVGTGTISHATLAAIGAALALSIPIEHVRRMAVDMGLHSPAR